MSSAKKKEVVVPDVSPRTLVYQAKYSKYKINKQLNQEFEDLKPVKKNFDLYLQGKESKNLKAKEIDWDDLFTQKIKPPKYNKDYPVYQEDYDLKVFATIKNKLESMSKEDKLTFSILKWIFNAMKKKDNTIYRKELVEQLDQNFDILQSLGFNDTEQIEHDLGLVRTKQIGKLNWEEFLDFFGHSSNSFKQTGETWWKTEQEGREYFIPINEPVLAKLDPETRKKQLSNQAYERMTKKADGQPVFSDLEGNRKAESNMHRLTDARVNKLIVEEIENELADLKKSHKKSAKLNNGDTQQTSASIGIPGITSEVYKNGPYWVLQNSHIAILKEIFNEVDRYNDLIISRHDFASAVRNNKTVQKFIDEEAVRIDKKTKLSLENILHDFEQEQYYKDEDDPDESTNHKEFFSFNEFVDFIENYQLPEERHSIKFDESVRSRQQFKTKREREEHMKQQIEEEKDRRIENIPRFREEDKIDTDVEYLEIVRDVFDTWNKIDDRHDSVDALQFFMNIKKDPNVIKINNVIAREPDGKSRIKTETFVEVFYRIEKSHKEKHLNWATILEYFTKRGRPLTDEEIEELKKADLLEDENYERHQENMKSEEEQFFNNLRNEQSDNFQTNRDELSIPDGRPDIEDMEHFNTSNNKFKTSGGQEGFRSTSKSNKRVSFKDSLNDRDTNFGIKPYSASKKKSNDFHNLSENEDSNSEHKRLKKRKETRSITIPKPFKFDTRENIRPKSIRERKVDEMIELKKIEEDNLLGYRFKAKVPSKEVLTPMFNDIMNKNEQRRMEVKTNSMKLLKEKECPFSFNERDKDKKRPESAYINDEFLKPAFKAKEVPKICSVEIFKVMMDKRDKEREIRVKKMSEQNFKKSKLPPRMEMHEKLK